MAKLGNTDCKANFPRKIRWTEEAISWLQDIHSYISAVTLV